MRRRCLCGLGMRLKRSRGETYDERLVGDGAISDEELYDRARSEGGESFPIEVADRLLAGESPIRVYRSYRGMTQQELAVRGRDQPGVPLPD